MSKTRLITGWILGGILVAFLIFASAFGKFFGGDALQPMFDNFGLGGNARYYIGAIEVVSALLFLLPRTGIIGTLLLTAYMGGAIVTHLEHGESFVFQVVFEAIIWICAFIRFPELSARLLGKKM